MTRSGPESWLSRWLGDYGMVVVLLLLAVFFSFATLRKQASTGAAAGEQLALDVALRSESASGVLIVARDSAGDREFSGAVSKSLEAEGVRVLEVINGEPSDVRKALERLIAAGTPPGVIACSAETASWPVVERAPELARSVLVQPILHRWPSFLTTRNLLNIANQVAVIAIIAIGMTMVIITAGIDLSVGSLIALSAVVAAVLLREYGGGREAGVLAMTLGATGGIAVCALAGAFSGLMVTAFRIPPFIVTLSMMLVASGLAYLVAQGQSVPDVPVSFDWLGRGADLFGIPNAVVLMLVLYCLAHVVMTRMTLGRYIYAVGGNPEAARLSGVPVRRVLLLVYTFCGALAGLGGIVTASLFRSGDPKYGETMELDVIAAVVVGGTSLQGGSGKIFGTLIGAFIIGVINNGMNLTEVESYTQKVVLGLVILAAVLVDTLKSRGGGFWRRRLRRAG